MGTFRQPGLPSQPPEGFIADQILEEDKKGEKAEIIAQERKLGRDQVFEKLYKMIPRMEGIAQRALGSDYASEASDVVSKALEYVIKSLDSGVFRREVTLETWFEIVVKSRAKDRLRAGRSKKNVVDASLRGPGVAMDESVKSATGDERERQFADPRPNIEVQKVTEEEQRQDPKLHAMRLAIGELSNKDALLGKIMQLVSDNASDEDIAKELSVNVAMVRRKKKEGLAALRKILEASEVSEEEVEELAA